MSLDRFVVPPGKKVRLKDWPTGRTGADPQKDEAKQMLQDERLRLADMQSKLYAQDKYALLIILQGIDAAGKDGTIKHVMSGVNPSGCHVVSFKQPSNEELDHDYLWRYAKALPERGRIGIFNRSHYEEVLVVRVHPELLQRQKLVLPKDPASVWSQRFREINHFEEYLVANGIIVLKFFLHLSKATQKERFLSRLDSPDKNWKFSEADVKERAYWDAYTEAFEDMLSHTSTEAAPWHIVPADQKWLTHWVVGETIVDTLQSLKLNYPKLTGEAEKGLERARLLLEREKEGK